MKGTAAMAEAWSSDRVALLARICGLIGAAGVLAALPTLLGQLPEPQQRITVSVLSLLSVAVVAMVAILAHVAGRLTGDSVIGWGSLAAAVYGVLIIPGALGADGDPAAGSVGGGLLPLLVSLLACAAVALGARLVVCAHARRDRPLGVTGLAAVFLALMHGLRLAQVPDLDGALVFAVAQVAAVGSLLGALVVIAHRAIVEVDVTHSAQREQLAQARRNLRHVAERDHEVRNAVAGLAGAATIIDSNTAAEREAAALRSAMAAELTRLEALLSTHREAHVPVARQESQESQGSDGSRETPGGMAMSAPFGDGAGPAPAVYRVRPILERQVALRRSTGMRIAMESELGLGAVGSPSVLAQVLTNLLTNCDRHAQGSPVRVRADRDGDEVRVLVSDLGPGIAVEPGDDVFASGVRDSASPGQGLGLHITRRLLAGEGGTISIRDRSVDRPGCTVEVRLPAVPAYELASAGRAAR
jgi:two-component system, OmpR family, sensor kinase